MKLYKELYKSFSLSGLDAVFFSPYMFTSNQALIVFMFCIHLFISGVKYI